MKKQIALFALVAAALVAAPTVIRAQDASVTNNNAAAAAPAGKKHAAPVVGKVAAVDAKAMTLTVGTKTFNITADTKIKKDGKEATLSEITVGEKVAVIAKKDDAGKLTAVSIHAGKKAEK
jgi:Cu/Ag efflux protein CusF